MLGSGSAMVSWKLHWPLPTTSPTIPRTSDRVPSANVATCFGAKIGSSNLRKFAVPRRIDLQRDQRADLADVDGLDARREDLRVGEHMTNVLIPADHHHRSVAGDVGDRCPVAEHLEHRLRIRKSDGITSGSSVGIARRHVAAASSCSR